MTIAVGDQLPRLTEAISREQIRAYADASGDQNPIHQDDAVAVAMGLPGIIAHGMLDFGLLSRCITDWLGDPARLQKLRVRFSNMVRPGDSVTCGGEVVALDTAAGTATLSVWAENQRGERVLGHGEAVVSLN